MIELTEEQKIIVDSKSKRILVNSFAGTGKSSTIKKYMEARPKEKKLYITFSKKMADEAKTMMSGIQNLEIRTTYSLAYKYVGYKFAGKIKAELSIYDYAKMIDYKLNSKEDYDCMYTAIGVFAYWMSSADLNPNKILNNENIVKKDEVGKAIKNIVRSIHEAIFLREYSGFISHAVYLKLWQISKPKLNDEYDIILLDEAQDSNECLACVMKNCDVETLVAVGDTYQEIFMFSGQKSGMTYLSDFDKYQLTKSFRFGEQNAADCNALLNYFEGNKDNKVNIIGANTKQIVMMRDINYKKKYILCRKNSTMFSQVEPYIRDKKTYYVDSFNSQNKGSISYNKEFVEILYNLRYHGTNNARFGLLTKFTSYEDAKLYHICSRNKNQHLTTAFILIEEYEEETLKFLSMLEKYKANTKENADLIISTVHQSKGLSISTPIQLANDFISIEYLDSIKVEKESEIWDKIKDEIYILYVAMTRSDNIIKYNSELIYLLENYIKQNKPISSLVKIISSNKINPIKIADDEHDEFGEEWNDYFPTIDPKNKLDRDLFNLDSPNSVFLK